MRKCICFTTHFCPRFTLWKSFIYYFNFSSVCRRFTWFIWCFLLFVLPCLLECVGFSSSISTEIAHCCFENFRVTFEIPYYFCLSISKIHTHSQDMFHLWILYEIPLAQIIHGFSRISKWQFSTYFNPFHFGFSAISSWEPLDMHTILGLQFVYFNPID